MADHRGAGGRSGVDHGRGHCLLAQAHRAEIRDRPHQPRPGRNGRQFHGQGQAGQVGLRRRLHVGTDRQGLCRFQQQSRKRARQGRTIPIWAQPSPVCACGAAGTGTSTSAALLFPDKTLLAEIDPRLAVTKVKHDRASLATQIADAGPLQALLDEAINNARTEPSYCARSTRLHLRCGVG